jgi:hypothetical protein
MPLLLGITHRVDQPSGTSDANSQSVGSLPQRTTCGHERPLTGSIDRHGYEHVVNTARCMENSDAVSDALHDAAASSTFEDHDNGFGEPIRFSSSTNSFHECSGCCRSIATTPSVETQPRSPHRWEALTRSHRPGVLGALGTRIVGSPRRTLWDR